MNVITLRRQEFAARRSDIRAEEAASRRRLDNLFASLLHRAFRGELQDRECGLPTAVLLYSSPKEIITMKEQLTAVFQQVPEGYIAFVEELPGANTQGDTLAEARANLQEAVRLVLEANRTLAEETLRDKTVIREPLALIS
jgi:predicted RNase H-like HicB family nuclease